MNVKSLSNHETLVVADLLNSYELGALVRRAVRLVSEADLDQYDDHDLGNEFYHRLWKLLYDYEGEEL